MPAPSVQLHHGEALATLRDLPDASIDACVTDPPYELAFMGRQWDSTGIAYSVELWAECLRVLKPGGHLAAFGGTRTYHRMACAIEDAGWEIRDSLVWLYSQGMAKSLDVSKAIDKQRDDYPAIRAVVEFIRAALAASGKTRADMEDALGGVAVAAHFLAPSRSNAGCPKWDQWLTLKDLLGFGAEMDAEVWRLNGRKGTPGEAWEQREVIGQSAWSNSAHHFVPGEDHTQRVRLDITAPATDDARRWQGWGTALAPAVEPIVLARKPLAGTTVARTVLEHGTGAINVEASKTSEGRWPKNVILDEHVAADLGDRARYFYCAKAPQSERPQIDGKGWPTVKPLNLMRWLVRLITPPDGTILDPFAGTASTLQAARDEGFAAIGIERDEFAYRLARQRLAEQPLTLDLPAA